MERKASIPLEQFTVRIANPTNRSTATTVSIYETGRFNMNGRLAGTLGGKKLGVTFTADANHFVLSMHSERELIYFPKSGSKKLDEVFSLLRDHGIAFPAKYDVWQRTDDGLWQGDLIANPTLSPSKRRRNSRKH